MALFGITLALMNLCFFQALERLPLGIAVTLEFVGPLTVAIFGSRSRAMSSGSCSPRRGSSCWRPTSVTASTPSGSRSRSPPALFWGLYILIAARVGRGLAGLEGLAVAMVVAAIILIPIGVVDGGSELLDPTILAIGLGVAFLSSALPYTVELEALKRLPERVFGVMLSLEPAVAALVGVVALDQALAGREIGAIALVVAASAGALSSADVVEAPQG